MEQSRTIALRKAKHPKTQTEPRSFLGLCNVYRRNYSHIAAPLNKFLTKGKEFNLPEFTAEQAEAFATLVTAVTTPPILVLPKIGLPYSVDTDDSDHQVGAALFQIYPDGSRKPIGYWSRSLIPAEKNYSNSERECLAVVWALATLRPYLQGEDFIVHSDHAALRWLMDIEEPSGRLMCWRLRLSELDFQVEYKKGKLNTQADALSRLATDGETTDDIDVDIPCLMTVADQAHPLWIRDVIDDEYDELLAAEPLPTPEVLTVITPEELIREQHFDPFCSQMRSRLNGGRRCQLRPMITVTSFEKSSRLLR